jgi:hypothetical protein
LPVRPEDRVEPVTLTVGGASFCWQDDWADWPDDEAAREGWSHHGLALAAGEHLYAFHPGESKLLCYLSDGPLVRAVRCPVQEAHGLTVVSDNGAERLWVSDHGTKSTRQADGSYVPDNKNATGQVLQIALDGKALRRLPTPELPVYRTRPYKPTAVAVDEVRHGGTGDIWVADGYGENLVHRFDAQGRYLGSISGAEGSAGRFERPHSIFIDRRTSNPELYVADRRNARVQVYGLDGTFRRSFGQGYLNSPSGFARLGKWIVIAELYARLAVIGERDELIGYLGADETARLRPGWPNALDSAGRTVRPAVTSGLFNSPHGLAIDPRGAIFVSEWLVGGRLVRLIRRPPAVDE